MPSAAPSKRTRCEKRPSPASAVEQADVGAEPSPRQQVVRRRWCRRPADTTVAPATDSSSPNRRPAVVEAVAERADADRERRRAAPALDDELRRANAPVASGLRVADGAPRERRLRVEVVDVERRRRRSRGGGPPARAAAAAVTGAPARLGEQVEHARQLRAPSPPAADGLTTWKAPSMRASSLRKLQRARAMPAELTKAHARSSRGGCDDGRR